MFWSIALVASYLIPPQVKVKHGEDAEVRRGCEDVSSVGAFPYQKDLFASDSEGRTYAE